MELHRAGSTLLHLRVHNHVRVNMLHNIFYVQATVNIDFVLGKRKKLYLIMYVYVYIQGVPKKNAP